MTAAEIEANVQMAYTSHDTFVPAADATRILIGMRQLLGQRGKRLVVIILPEETHRLSTPQFYAEFASWIARFQREVGIDVLDCHDALREEEFVDHIHPDVNGAAHLTSLVAAYLRARIF